MLSPHGRINDAREGLNSSDSITRCGVVWCGVVWCGVVWCGVVWCGVRVSLEAALSILQALAI